MKYANKISIVLEINVYFTNSLVMLFSTSKKFLIACTALPMKVQWLFMIRTIQFFIQRHCQK